MGWFEIRTKTEAPAFNAVRAQITGWPEKVFEDVYRPALQEIARDGVAYMRQIIDDSTTPTGEARASRGGAPGRVATGYMRKMVQSRVRTVAKGGVSIFVGWVYGKPGYAIFQELGTKNGIQAMNAIGQTYEYMYSRVRALSKGIKATREFELGTGEE